MPVTPGLFQVVEFLGTLFCPRLHSPGGWESRCCLEQMSFSILGVTPTRADGLS